MVDTRIEPYIKTALRFAHDSNEVLAMGLCGSWARGNSHADSDVDFSIIVENPARFVKTDWYASLNLNHINESLESFRDHTYGAVWSRHVLLKSGLELELSFADRNWARTDPVDKGTQKVVTDGYKILYDPYQILYKLVRSIKPVQL